MIFSNTNKEHWDSEVLASGGRLALIEAHLSHELGAEKPDLESYQLVAARAGLPPESLLFFDDLPANVEGARRAGWQAEVFTGEAALRTLLVSRGFDISLH
jgi:FMN phosphatase YigB (HAD superfamily)